MQVMCSEDFRQMSLLQTINLRLVRRNRSMKWKRCAYRISLQTESVDFVCTAIKYSVTMQVQHYIFEVGTAADADPINVKITNDTKSPVNTKEVSA